MLMRENLFTSKNGFINRRDFFKSCGACAACLALSKFNVFINEAAISTELLPRIKPKVKVVFTHIGPENATWPYIGYDYEGRKRELTKKLVDSCRDIEFSFATARNSNEAKAIIDSDRNIDGYLVYLIGIWSGAPRVFAESGTPTIFVDDLYAGSGEFLIEYAVARRTGKKVAGVSSSNFQDVVNALKCFSCLKKLKDSKAIDITDRENLWGDVNAIKEVWGTEIIHLKSEELNRFYNEAALDKASNQAKLWIRNARKVIEPNKAEIERSARIYLAMSSLLQKYQAQAIAIDCLGLFYGGRLPAYPCLGFFQFNNDGLVGACEGDLASTMTMLIMRYLTGLPGFISDPVLDTSKNQIIYAHCVCSNKVFGPEGPANPYDIRSHSEDRKGAAVRSLLPKGKIVTTLQFNPTRKEVVLHKAKTVDNIDESKACRTKLAAEVIGDINKLMTEWDRWGWHRVTFFGDLQKQVETLSTLMGFKIIYEA